jgi:hypothetical protein
VLDEAFWVSAGGGITADGGSVREARYVLDTGSSWAGKIGAVEVLLDLSQSGVQLPAKPIPLRRLAPDGSARSYDGWPKLPLGTVLWKGFTSPTVTPTGLRFFGKNLKPSIADDLALDFGYKPAR